MVSKDRTMVMQTGITAPLFAAPSIVAGDADQAGDGRAEDQAGDGRAEDQAGDGRAEAGALLLSSTEPLADYPVTVMHSVRAWAAADPAHPMVAERDAGGGWRICTYGEAVAAADAIGQALLDRGLGPERPLLVLSGNGVDHLLITLAVEPHLRRQP